MPFCRDCGKEVQEEWTTCPFCSSSLEGLPQNLSLQDSVMTGDLVNKTTINKTTQNITEITNDAETISTAVRTASKCVCCGSTGITQITCSVCKEYSHCNICSPEIGELRREERLCKKCAMEILDEMKTKLVIWKNELNRLLEIRRVGVFGRLAISFIFCLVFMFSQPTYEINSIGTFMINAISLIMMTLILSVPLSYIKGLGDNIVVLLKIERLKGDLNSWEDEKLMASIRELELEYNQYLKEL